VDLTPLFQWWAREPLVITNTAADKNKTPESERPLTAWNRVTGIKVGTLASSWVVDAIIYSSPTIRTNARIILNHPPEVEEATFDNLRSQLNDTEQQLANARRVYQDNTNAEAQAQAVVAIYRRSLSKVASDGVILNSRIAADRHAAAATALIQMDQLEATRDQLEKQLKTIPSVLGAYRVDWFAVELGRTKQGVLIYDLGLVSATPP